MAKKSDCLRPQIYQALIEIGYKRPKIKTFLLTLLLLLVISTQKIISFLLKRKVHFLQNMVVEQQNAFINSLIVKVITLRFFLVTNVQCDIT